MILRAAKVARRAPEEWANFLAEFQNYADARRDQCVSSPADTIFVAQGRAQQCASLLRLFEECVRAADQLEKK